MSYRIKGVIAIFLFFFFIERTLTRLNLKNKIVYKKRLFQRNAD